MELSPEERQRIYAEEKARLEAQQALKAEKKPGWGKRMLGCLGIAIGAIIALAIIGNLLPEPKKKPGSQGYTAQLMAERFIKGQLRAPTTAEFGGETATHLGEEKYSVTGYVDAQNAFGAKLRSVWTCTVQNTDGHTWTRHEPCQLLK